MFNCFIKYFNRRQIYKDITMYVKVRDKYPLKPPVTEMQNLHCNINCCLTSSNVMTVRKNHNDTTISC